MEHHDQLVKQDPYFQKRLQQIESFALFGAKNGLGRDEVIKIPVVVHVVYHNPRENISSQQIQSQIKVLNEDFRRKNQDARSTDPRFMSLASDSKIEFFLAQRDPYGNPTDGITRTYTSKLSFAAFTDEVKRSQTGGAKAWPANDYLNIWVCNLDMGVLGFAQFPGGRKDTDGVVIGYKYFGTVGTVATPFNLGRTTTHEVGHWLNLRHIWGDGPCGNDGVDDTPSADGPHHGCVSVSESCGSPDMVQNFMDYTDDACMNFFTRGQKTRMRSLFVSGGARHSLLSSPALHQPQVLACEAPVALEAKDIETNRALLSWKAKRNVDQYEVRMRRLPGGQWKSRVYDSNSARVVRLYPCTNYEFSVRSICANDGSSYSPSIQFSTLGCGNQVPADLVADAVSPRQAVLSWEPVTNAHSYEIQFIAKYSRKRRKLIARNTRVLLDQLEGGQLYYVRVRALLNRKYSNFSDIAVFRTPRSGYIGPSRPAAKMEALDFDWN